MAGLFDTFTVAKRGLNVQQGNINTTSHNIANAKTQGYSRQRAVTETTRPFGGMSRFDTTSAGQVGTGAQITTIQRVRDTFIDYQVRSENGTAGYYVSRSETLAKIEDVFAEPSDKGLEELMTKFYSAFQEVSKNPGSQDIKAAAIKQASALCDQINYSYEQLNKARNDSQKLLLTDVTDVNSYLDQINELNKEIRGVSALGQAPNDLMDRRDNLLDDLSKKFGLKMDRDKFETINLSSNEYSNFPLVKSNPNDEGYARFSYVNDAKVTEYATGKYKIEVDYYPLGNEKAELQSFSIEFNTASKSEVEKLKEDLLQNRILLADKDGKAIIKTPSSNGSASIILNKSPLGVDVDTSVDASTKKITINFTDVVASPTPAPAPDTIVINEDGTIDSIPSGYTATQNVDGTMNVTTDFGTTIKVGKDGSIESKASDVKQASMFEVKTSMFQTYKYDTESSSAVNNVDNNNVKGEIAGNQSVQNSLKAMMDGLDRLAEGLAYTVNAIQTGSIISGDTAVGIENNALIFVNNDATSKTDEGITAKNLKINSDLLSDPTKLNCNTTSTSGTGDGKRAAAISNLSVLKMKISNITPGTDLSGMKRETYLTTVGVTGFADTNACLDLKGETEGSTTDSYYKSLTNALGIDVQEAKKKVDNQEVILAKLEDDRMEVSGVSLDEETTNLIQYQHAYQANAKMIATIDELLDVVINGLKK